jgi:hypothetical protein
MKNKKVNFNSFYENSRDKKYTGKKTMTGKFQKWGDFYISSENKTFTITVGIILGDDDKIYCVPPNSITIIK